MAGDTAVETSIASPAATSGDAGTTTVAQPTGTPAPKRARVSGTLDASGATSTPRAGMPEIPQEALDRYRECATEVGMRQIAKSSAGFPLTTDRKRNFLDDHARYMSEIGGELKLRTIGGNKLDLYTLYVSVLERGGVQAVISSRTFRLVARALNLPRSCTSAAYILRSDYEKMLYFYEQKHVWGREPEQAPPLTVLDRNARPTVQPAQIPRGPKGVLARTPVRATPRQATPQPVATPASRPKRQAALAASNAVAAAAAELADDLYGSPGSSPIERPRRTRTNGVDELALTPTQEAIVEEEVPATAPHATYMPGTAGERERVIGALWSTVHEDVAFALGTLNALSYDPRNTFQARQFPGLLDALYEIMHRHREDVRGARSFSLPAGAETEDRAAPRMGLLSTVEVADAGEEGVRPGVGVTGVPKHDDVLRSSSLQQYGTLFNVVDSIAVDREQCAVVAVNILRNMSFSDRNVGLLAESQPILELSSEMILTIKVPGNIRDGLMDVWINVAPYLNVSQQSPGNIVLTTCIKLLDPFLEGADFLRFTNCGEVLARLAASPERNEDAFVSEFNELLPRLVDMLGGKDRRYINAGLAALCNCSAFDWPARSRIARVPRAMPRLVNMLADAELAPRAALTLLNLAEAPSNRSVLLAYEKQLVEQAIKVSPAADTLASVLFDLSND